MRAIISPFFSILVAGVVQALGAAYYVDGTTGDDSRDGLSQANAWQTLAKVNGRMFQPGDSILFRAGTRYSGRLVLSGSGTAANPIFVGAHGTGNKPLIEAGGQAEAVLLRNASYWTLSGLEVTNQGATRANSSTSRVGVRLTSNNSGIMRGIRLLDLFIRDVNGSLTKNDSEGHGILFESMGGQGSRFDGLLIENCRLLRTDRNGICQFTSNGSRSTGVAIRGNLLEDIGGDCIKIWGSNGALVERNTVRGGRMRAPDYAAGIWPYESDNTVIQFNEVSGMHGTLDGQGFDSDYLCNNTVIQYNYSHDNEGGFILMCAPGDSYSRNAVVRYNLSVRDGINSARVIQIGGKVTGSRIYNNTFYLAANQNLPIIAFNEWDGGIADSNYFYNNIFYVDGRARYDMDASRNNFFENNVYYGNQTDRPADARAVTQKPPLANPGFVGSGLAGAEAYRFVQASDAFLGRVVQQNGGRDYFGGAVSAAAPPYTGFHQYGAVTALRSAYRGRETRSLHFIQPTDLLGRRQKASLYRGLWGMRPKSAAGGGNIHAPRGGK